MNLLAGPFSRAFTSSNNSLLRSIARNCVLSNFAYFITIYLLVIPQIVRVSLYLLNAAHSKKVAKLLGSTRQIQNTFQTYNKSDAASNADVKQMRVLRIFSGRKFRWVLTWLLNLIAIFVALVNADRECPELNIIFEEECDFFNNVNARDIFQAYGVLIILFGIFFTICYKYGVFSYPDPFNLIRELKWLFMSATPLGFLGLLLAFVDPLGVIVDTPEKTYKFAYFVFVDLAVCVCFFIVLIHPIYVVTRSKKRLNGVSLANLLKTKTGKTLFLNHLVNEFSSENLFFYLEAQKWINEVNILEQQMSSQALISRAETIFSTFVESGSQFEINISHASRSEVSLALRKMKAEAKLNPEVFSSALEEVFTLMETDSYPRFSTTNEFNSFTGVLSASRMTL
eukprot:snap_masked-scaffold_34-processed-gene-2.12-mRNA-1 protein AED:1.00 eAED:1.00 QI:0/-1/0/0/-1/1/1/0/397